MHIPPPFVTIVTICLGLAFGAGCAGAQASLPAPAQSQAIPSGTLPPVSTAPTTPTPLRSVTPSLTPARQATALSVPSGIAPAATTSVVWPTLPVIAGASRPQLARPAPEALLNLVQVFNGAYAFLQDDFSGEPASTTDRLRLEVQAASDALGYELQHHYPDGLPDPRLILDAYPLESGWFPLYPPVYLDLLTDAFLAKLNDEQTPLADHAVYLGDGYQAHRYLIELDHDPGPEWLVLIRWTSIGALTWLALDEGPGPAYVALQTELPVLDWASTEGDDELQALEDFTGDGLTDVIFLDYGYLMGTDFGTFYIAQGAPTGFKRLSEVSQLIPGYLSSGLPYAIGVPDGSRWLTLSVSDPHSLNWDCAWDTVTTYRWPYGEEQVVVTGQEAPHTPDCQLAQAVSLLDPPDHPTAVTLLERAIARFDTDEPKQFAKAMFAHYRLALLYALEKQPGPARRHADWFAAHYTGPTAFLNEKLLPLLDAPALNPIQWCSLMASADVAELPALWPDYANATAAFNAYPYSPELYPPVICPLRDLIASRLAAVRFDPAQSPATALRESGLPVAAVHAYPVPAQAHPAWFVLIGDETLFGAGYLLDGAGWHWQVLYQFHRSSHTPDITFEDITGDSIPELAFVLPSQTAWWCPEQEQAFNVFVTTASGWGLVSTGQTMCAPEGRVLDMKTVLADGDGDGRVDWVVEQLRTTAETSPLLAERVGPPTWFSPAEIQSFIQETPVPQPTRDLAQAVFQAADLPEVRAELLGQRDRLAATDPNTAREWQRLTYLIAVSYEREGRRDEALAAFLNVIQAEPHTPWSYLAALHIQID